MQISTFNAFKSRNYRLFFTGQSISLIGTWMQKTAVSWVVYTLTHSKVMLGVTAFASMFPSFLLSFLGGIAADRYDRYKLLLWTQIVSMIQAIILTVLIFLNYYSISIIIILSILLGIVNAFDVPARQSLVYEMVNDKKDLPNALALNSSMVNLSRLIGPGIAGVIMEKLGDGVCFGLNALSFVAVIISLMMMRLPKHEIKAHKKDVGSDFRDGIRYVKNNPSIYFLLIMLSLMGLFVLPFATLVPVYAKDIFHGTASTFGLIDSAIGLGAFAGAIYLASLKPGRNLQKVLAVNTFIFGAGLILFSYTTSYPLGLLFTLIGAFGMMSQMTVTNTLIQTTVDASMRGRVISLYAMSLFGMMPIGGLLVGSISQWVDVQNTVLAEGIMAIIIGILHVRFIKKHHAAKMKKIAVDKEPVDAVVQVTV